MAFDNSWCLDLVYLLLLSGVFLRIEYLYALPVVSVLSSILTFCAFGCPFYVCEIWFIIWVFDG